MTKHKRRALSAALAVAMTLSMSVAAFAAGGSVSITGKGPNAGNTFTSTNDIELFREGAETVTAITVQAPSYTDRVISGEALGSTVSDTLPGGTQYQVYSTTNSEGIKTYKFKWTHDLLDDVTVDVQADTASYTVHTNGGAYGQNNNYGGANTVTFDGDTDTAVTGGTTYRATFTPKQGQEIFKFNVRANSTDGAGSLLDATKNGSGTVASIPYSITVNGDGSVTLSLTATRNIWVTALTQERQARYTLSVSTDGSCSSDVVNEQIVAGSTKNVTLTPVSGYNIGDIVITDGGKTGTISYNGTSATVNGKKYTVERKLDGSAVVAIPAANADVSISASATDLTRYVYVRSDSNASSDQDGTRWVGLNDSFTVTFEPDNDAIIRSVSIKTSSGTYTADAEDNYIVVEGTYYRMYEDYDGSVTIYLTGVGTNMEIRSDSEDTTHVVKVKTDKGCDSNWTTRTVDDGDSLDVEIVPDDYDSYPITQLKVSYDGDTYTADPSDDTYIRVNGQRWGIVVTRYGTVTLSMTNIEHDVTVTASTDKPTGSYRIAKSADTHSTIKYTGSSPFDYDEDTTVTVTADDKYILKSVKFAMGSKSVTIEPFDTSFTLGKTTYTVDWEDNGEMSVYIPSFSGNLTITSKSVKGDTEYPGAAVGTYHMAYMVGYGDGTFGPSDVLTRAQAIVLLNRIYCGQAYDGQYAGYSAYSYYADVPVNTWYTSSVNYAYLSGKLTNVFGSNFFFFFFFFSLGLSSLLACAITPVSMSVTPRPRPSTTTSPPLSGRQSISTTPPTRAGSAVSATSTLSPTALSAAPKSARWSIIS